MYARLFRTEKALVRPSITIAVHALTIALSANLRPGDELLSPVGKPYDTLEGVIGIKIPVIYLTETSVKIKGACPRIQNHMN